MSFASAGGAQECLLSVGVMNRTGERNKYCTINKYYQVQHGQNKVSSALLYASCRDTRYCRLQRDHVGSFSPSPAVLPSFAFVYEQKITMGQANPKEVAADYVELTIKGQFVPRADLYRFLTAASGSTAYGGKMFEFPVRRFCGARGEGICGEGGEGPHGVQALSR